jgi:1-acyl-sn-glycerol-3-phosphate acyltransferase
MNNALVLDKQVVIAKKVCKNWESVNKKDKKLITNMSGLTFVYIDALGNKYRSKKNIPVSITGTGLMVRNDLIKEIKGWPYKTLTEDFELVMSCIINKYTSTYYEHAVVYCEEPTTHHETVKRRVRWLSGYAQVNKKYRKDVIKTTFPFKFSLIGFDFLYSLLPVYFFFGLSGVLVILGLLYSLYGHYHNIDISLYVNGSLNILLIVYLVLVFYTLIGLIAERKSIKLNFWDKILVLLFNPFFMAEYLFIIILAFMNKTNQNWVLTKREEVNYNLNNHNGESNKERALRLMHEYELEGKFNEHVYPIDPQSFEEVKADYEYHNRHQIRIFLVRFIAFIVSFIISKFIFRTKVKGLENLKNIKGCILISNHIDHLDSLPIRYYLRKKLYILSGQFNNKKGLLGFLLKNSGCLPLSNNIVSMKNLNKEISNLLKKKNNALLICPEGSEWPHYRKPRPFHSGAFHYAVKNNVPIVPLFYTFKKTIFGYKHYLNILKPIEVPSDIIGREAQIMMQEKAYSAFVQTYEGFYEGVKLI